MDNIALDYLSPPEGAFWRWQENGEVIEWVDGKTITFRAELLPILRSLSQRGLPSLGAILLVLAAVRDMWPESIPQRAILAGILGNCSEPDETNRLLTDVLSKLDELNSLEADLRTWLEAKIVLCDTIFAERVSRTSAETAHRIVRQLALGLGEELTKRQLSPSSTRRGANELLNDLRDLDRCLEQIDQEQLRLHRQTGLDQVPQPADVELPMAQAVRVLLTQLLQDDELSGLARLALNLMAAVTMPRAVADREELQMGGVSDITNRGPLDRLLLSELANDDLTLAVRVALNEAMYLRRESPPRTPPRQRAVLLEAGLRSWGVPRVFSTAVALALAATSDSHVEYCFRRARKTAVVPVELTTRAALVEHLAALESEVHPGQALAAFEAELATADNPGEPLLIVAEDILEDAHFRALLDEREMLPLHIATVNREGRFRLLERNLRGSKLLREATLSLEPLFAEPRRSKHALIDRELDYQLPAIFACQPFPLLLSHQVDHKRLACVKGRGVITLTHDGRLMFWHTHHQGAMQLSDRIPAGALWWCSRNPISDMVYAVVGHLSPRGLHLLQIDLEQRSCLSMQLELHRGARAICEHRGMLFAIFQQCVQVIDPSTGNVVQTLDLPTGFYWMRGRFFRKNPSGSWFALSYDGRSALLEPVLTENNRRCPTLQTLFERDGIDGPIGITVKGDLYFTATDALRKIRYDSGIPPRVMDITPDGSRVALTFPKSPAGFHLPHRVLNVDTFEATRTYNSYNWNIDSDLVGLISTANLRHRFVYACITEDDVLALCTRKNHLLGIECRSPHDHFALTTKRGDRVRARVSFSPMKLHTQFGFQLFRAGWEDGSVAILDTRGLLHLKSSDRTIPECTIVLTEGELSGWCSDGRLWGQRYFIGRESASKREVFDSVIRTFVERLR